MRAIILCFLHMSIYAHVEININATELKSNATELKPNVSERKSNATEIKLNTTEQNKRAKYIAEPNWEKLDLRPCPAWYDDAKIGIFIHWGVYSVPGFKNEWFWYYMTIGDKSINEFMLSHNYESYFDFAPMFTAEKFDPDQWAELFAKSGAKYVVLTSKHHDGFALFPSGRSNWNSVDVGPKIDIVDAVSKAVRKHNLKFGVYYSLTEWFNKLLKKDKKQNYKTTVYTDSIVWPDIQYLVNTYKPSVLWSDGDWDGSYVYWKSRELLTWLYNESPVKDEIVVNDRWGNSTNCQHGDFENCEDRYEPGFLLNHKWESAFTLDKESWGFREEINSDAMMTFEELLMKVVSTVSCGAWMCSFIRLIIVLWFDRCTSFHNYSLFWLYLEFEEEGGLLTNVTGNVLINVGPSKEGIIAQIFQDRLLQLGDWLQINGEAIYKTAPFHCQKDTFNADVWYTCIDSTRKLYKDPNFPPPAPDIRVVFLIFLKWPEGNKLTVECLVNFMSHGTNYSVELWYREGRTQIDYQISDEMDDLLVVMNLPELNDPSSRTFGWVVKIKRLD